MGAAWVPMEGGLEVLLGGGQWRVVLRYNWGMTEGGLKVENQR